MNWYKGTPHCHTIRSDGDSSLEHVVEWYAKRKFDWLVIADHWRGLPRRTAKELSDIFGILVIPGSEISGSAHVVGVGVVENCRSEGLATESCFNALQCGVDWVNAHNGLPILAHPNWTYMWDSVEALGLHNVAHFEVHNGSTDCNTFAAGGKQGTDDIWNAILNTGRLFYGVGSDDAHVHAYDGLCPEHCNANGATAWTLTECATLTETNVINALKIGRFVASSGPRVSDFGILDGQYFVDINEPYAHFHYTTTFFGKQGVLAEIHGRSPRYTITGNEQWIRARCFCTSGRYLWTQPVFI
ncbi:MAG: CehA/McbA family metallohydrolase [Negativicutes bacterium]